MKVPKKRRPARITKAWRAVEWALKHRLDYSLFNVETEEVPNVGYYSSVLHYEGPIPPHVAIYPSGYESEGAPEDYDLKLVALSPVTGKYDSIYIYYI